MDAGRSAADASYRLWRRNPHTAKERPQRQFDSVGELRYLTLHIERDQLAAALWKLVRQHAVLSHAVHSIWKRQSNFTDLDLEHIAGFGSFNVNRTGKEVAAFAGIRFDNFKERRLDLRFLYTDAAEEFRSVDTQRFDLHDVA